MLAIVLREKCDNFTAWRFSWCYLELLSVRELHG